MRFRSHQSSLKLDRRFVKFEALLLALALALTLASSRTQADTANCNGQTLTLPFTDVQGSGFFCFIAQLYFQQITLGTSPTTYSPADNVRRDQMAAFLARTQNSTLNRGSRRAALNQLWTTTPHYGALNGIWGATLVGDLPELVASDGADLWVANNASGTVSRVRASDGKALRNYPGAACAYGVLVAMNQVFVTENCGNRLWWIDPTRDTEFLVPSISTVGNGPYGIAFDGAKIWTANNGSISIITPDVSYNWPANTIGGFGRMMGAVYDGANIWMTEEGVPGQLKKFNASGGVITSVTVGNDPRFPIYDGTNIWVPNLNSNSVSIVRPSDGAVLATLTGNGLNGPASAAFDGQRILITNYNGNSVSLFRAADFAPLGSFATGNKPLGACSDGLNFWITLVDNFRLARF